MDPKVQLAREYCKLLDNKILWILKLTGYLRFATRNGYIIERGATTSFLRCMISIISGNSSGFYMFYVLRVQENYLILSEVIILMLFALVQNSILLNIAGPNRNSGLTLLNYCIEIDCHIGVKDTKFMRDIAIRTYLILMLFIGFFQAIIVTVLIFAYRTSVYIHIVGTIYFALLFFIFYDICFLLTFYAFLALRVHYLNVAILKRGDINAEYFPKQFLFDGLLWKKEFDNLVTFHKSASSEQFSEAFKIIFKILRHLEKCYRFAIFMGMCTVTLGTFLFVPLSVTTGRSTDFSSLRTTCAMGWVVLGWIYEYGFGQQTDLFCHQIDETKLICTYIQLEPTGSDDIIKLTRRILNTLEIREPRLSLYGLCYLNTGLILRFAASIFIYITVQLQILLPSLEEISVVHILEATMKSILCFLVIFALFACMYALPADPEKATPPPPKGAMDYFKKGVQDCESGVLSLFSGKFL